MIDATVVGRDPKGRRDAWSDRSARTTEERTRCILETKVGEGFRIETHTDTHAIIVAGGPGTSLLSRFRRRGAGRRFVISVDEHGEMTVIPAEPRRS